MSRLRLRTTVLGGAAVGLIAGAMAFGAVSSSSAVAFTPVNFKPAAAQVALANQPPPAAPCAPAQTLEKDVCVVHVKKVVVDPASEAVQANAPADRSADRGSGSSSSGKRASASGQYQHESESEGGDDD